MHILLQKKVFVFKGFFSLKKELYLSQNNKHKHEAYVSAIRLTLVIKINFGSRLNKVCKRDIIRHRRYNLKKYFIILQFYQIMKKFNFYI